MAKTKKTPARKTSKKKSSSDDGFFITAFKFCVKWGLVLGLWMAIVLGGILLWYAAELPTITKSMVFERRPTVTIIDNNGDIADRYGDIKGKIVSIEELPPHVVNAVLATEDRRFYDHFGMDLKGFARAVFVNISRGGFVQGGSTITQQLAKNLFLTRERTIKRKIQELMLSFQLERELTKDEILSSYLNRVYLGSGAYGIDAAAKVYFNKPATDLNLTEAATIAGLLKAPSRYSPAANPSLSKQRTKVVMNAMLDAEYITQAQLDEYKNMPPSPRRKPSSADSVRYYTDYIVAQLQDLIGPVEEDVTVETTLEPSVQKELEQAVTKALLKYGPDKDVEQAAGMFMRLDGAVVALMGGRDYGSSEFNRATDSLRPPGSSFKPIIYLTALEQGWSLNSYIEDKPRNYGRYRPRNYGHKYYGWVTLFEALTLSLNTVAIEVMSQVKPQNAVEMAQRLGITADLEPNLSTALGSNGVPMTQMVTAYGTIARGGLPVQPYAIKRIKDKDSKVLYEHTKPEKVERVVSRRAVAQLTAMMQSVVKNGTGRAASIGYHAAGKTGTSQDFRDAWFIGFTNKYAGAVWFGNDDNSPTKRLTGGSAPAQVWGETMLSAQRRGGKSYGLFQDISHEEDGFSDMLDRVSSSYNSDFQFGSGNMGSWLGGLFGGGNTIEHDIPNDLPDALKEKMRQQRQNMDSQPDRYKAPTNNKQTQGGYSSNVNE